MIIFRTNASFSSGIGHLARSRRLAIFLNKNGYKVSFALDYQNEYLNNFLIEFQVFSVYSLTESYLNQEDDAKRTIRLFSKKEVKAIIIDDYRFFDIWESVIRNIGCKIVVLDDQDKNNHICDLLVDAKWEGIKTLQRYKNKIHKDCMRLLGPKYLLIDNPFESNPNFEYLTSYNKKTFRILLSLGGGGNLLFLTSLIEPIINLIPKNLNLKISVVVGPYAIKQNEFLHFSEKYDELNVILNQDGLFDEMSKTNLYIGTSGGTLFEALSLKIPCLTFSMGENQQNEHSNFEDLGHFLHLNEVNELDFSTFASLVLEIITQYDRVLKLYQQSPLYRIDWKGVKRVGRAIHNIIVENNITKSEDINVKESTEGISDYELVEINDNEINRYLDARNQQVNLEKGFDKDSPTRINHYLWWLKSNKKTSYVLKKNQKNLLYIWHEVSKVKKENVIFSGWFISDQSCSALDAMYAITEHSRIIDYLFPSYYWIIVMKIDNYFMQKLHRRLKFKIVEKDGKIEKIVNQFLSNRHSFSKAKSNEFMSLYKKI
jgi:UDP-2,4-diacetamido-2,4,6-trideoxy-beta-L-altropyranose hydrolase